ncbi:hypothetical protein CAEBREN_01463 [Caenorhabditis brenneri]|uniref:F-box domain-containing protein n=1 Tax=Caenorhabditis brenneri TaxID=135651 RepID=G0N2J1_CAEBE|nr:hypothetical protein CAEBREN_01463 [Caenorhabditis brenneri]
MDPSTATEVVRQREEILFQYFLFREAEMTVYEAYLGFSYNKKMGYKEYDFWFNRFANGKYNLKYDNSLEPKTREFSDMPIELVDKILSHVEHPLEKTKLRGVCTGFRDIIDYQMTRYKDINIFFHPYSIRVFIDQNETVYRAALNGCSASYNEQLVSFYGQDLIGTVRTHLEYVLKNPKMKLNEFFMSEFVPFLTSIKHQLNVKSANLPSATINQHTHLLQYFKPGVLERINFMIEDQYMKKEDLEELYQTEQWKQATIRRIAANFVCDLPTILGLVRQTYSFMIMRPNLIPEELEEFKKIFFNSPTIRYGEIFSKVHDFNLNLEQLKRALGEHLVNPYDSNCWAYPIPDSNELLQFTFSRVSARIAIERIH